MLYQKRMHTLFSTQQKLEDALCNTRVAVVVPAYRVADHIAHVIANIPAYVRHIIVVDDCSPDLTAQCVQSCYSTRVHLVRHRVNEGVGGAMLTGYAMALKLGAEIVVKMDGDDQMDPRYLPMLLLPILAGEADYTKGNRFLHMYALRHMPLARRVGNAGLTFLTKLASGYWNVFDPTNGYTAIHTNVLRLLNTERIARRYFFETSMLLELRQVQAVVHDVPMPARYGNEISSMSLRRVLITFPIKLLRGFIRRLGWQYFMFDFNAASLLMMLSLPLLLFGILWGAYHWYHSYITGIVATTGTVLLAVLPIILGMQFLVQALVLDIGSVPRRVLHTHLLHAETALTHTAPLSIYLETHDPLVAAEHSG